MHDPNLPIRFLLQWWLLWIKISFEMLIEYLLLFLHPVIFLSFRIGPLLGFHETIHTLIHSIKLVLGFVNLQSAMSRFALLSLTRFNLRRVSLDFVFIQSDCVLIIQVIDDLVDSSIFLLFFFINWAFLKQEIINISQHTVHLSTYQRSDGVRLLLLVLLNPKNIYIVLFCFSYFNFKSRLKSVF